MSKIMNAGSQQRRDYLYRADGSITTGGTPQLVLGASMSRSHIFLQNTSSANLVFEIGSGAATATIVGGVVSAIAVTNVGFNYTKPPLVRLLGGGQPQSFAGAAAGGPNTSYVGLGQPNAPSPPNAAQAHALLTGGAISSIVIDNPGSSYIVAPYVLVTNSDLDPNGCALPSAASGALLLSAGASLYYNGTVCPTEPVGVFGATTGQTFICRWMD